MNRVYLRKLLYLAIPIMLSNIIAQLQMMIDRIFLGRMNSMYMSALGNVNSPVWTTMSFCMSIGIGASILISQGVGANNKDQIKIFSAALMKWNNILPVILFFFWTFCSKIVFQLMGVSSTVMEMCQGYIRYYAPVFLIVGIEASFMVIMQTSNYTQPMILFGIIRAGLNVFLDWVLIFGKFGLPSMGIKGAALATMIAEYVGFLYACIVYFKCNKLTTRPGIWETIKAPVKPYLRSIRLGVLTAMEDLAWNLGNLMLIRILNTIHEMAAGIYSIVFGIEVIVVVIIGAVGNATMTLSGEAKGKRDFKQYRGVVLVAYALSAVVSTVMLIVCLITPDTMIGLFTKDTEIIKASGLYLLIMCVNLYGKGANIIIGNGIRGSGNTKWMFFTQLFGTFFVIALAATFVFGLQLGIVGVFMAVVVDEFVRAVINLVRFLRIRFGEDK